MISTRNVFVLGSLALAACGDPAASPIFCPSGQTRVGDACLFSASARPGCTNSRATNFDPDARVDDGTCQFPMGAGCTNSKATNFDPNATADDGSCMIPGCTIEGAANYDADANQDNGACLFGASFTVDMANVPNFTAASGVFLSGSFNDWCGTCEAMTDGGNGSWTVDVQLPAGSHEYKFVIGPAPGAGVPEVVPFGCDVNEDPMFDARGLAISTAAVSAESTAYGSCPGVELPFAVDLYYVPSGLMGDGEEGRITIANCPMRAPSALGTCHQFDYAAGGTRGFGGAFWQYPANNWGPLPGLALPPGATRISFSAWGAVGGESINFLAGISDADGFGLETGAITLTNTPTEYSIPLTGVSYNAVVGSFGWVDEAAAQTIFVDNIRWERHPDDVGGGGGGGAMGCTDSAAVNYDAAAMTDDGSCRYSVTFEVDMNCPDSTPEITTFSSVNITGPFCQWCSDGFPLADPDGDNVFTGSFEFTAGQIEFKYMVDGFSSQEDLLDDVLEGGMCAPVNDGANFANRQVDVQRGMTHRFQHTYGRCGPCGG